MRQRSILKRCVFTGESYQQALQAIELLEGERRLIPDAVDSDQQWLEAILLHRMLRGWTRRPLATARTTVLGVRAVQPSPTGLTLVVPAGAEPGFAKSLAADAIVFRPRGGRDLSMTVHGIAAEVGLTCSWRGLQEALVPGSIDDTASPALAHRSVLSALLRRLILFTREEHFNWLMDWHSHSSTPPPASLAALLADPRFGVPGPVLDTLRLTSPARGGAVTITRSSAMDELPIGRRIAYWRGRRKMSQQVFADRLGKTKSWVDKVERGVRRLDRFSLVYDIADVLQVDVEVLLGREVERRPEAQNSIDQVEVEQIRAALERYDQMSTFFQAVPQSPPLAEIRKAVSHAWLTYQHAKYGALTQALPKLLRDAQAADCNHAGTAEAREAAHLLGQVYQIASSALRKVGEHELSWLAADRSIAVSQRAGDQLLAGRASYRVGSALLALGRTRPSLEVNVNIANRLASGSQDRLQERLSVYGTLLLNGAMAAARAGDGTTVRDLLAGAEEAAQELGGDFNHYWTSFGPTNVQLHRDAAAVEAGDGGAAVKRHERLGPERFAAVPTERRARHYLDIARGYTQVGDVEKAGEMLLEGDRLAPSEIRSRPLAHEVLSDVLRRTRGTPPAPIAELAEQMGIGV